MSFRSFAPVLSLVGLLGSSSAFAGVDLQTTMTGPSAPTVYVTGTYSVTVKNNGSSSATGASLVVALPVTHTSPSVYVMGTVGAMSGSCAPSGNTLVCSLGTIKSRKSTTVTFDLALPQSTSALTVSATASGYANDTNPANNTASVTPTLLHPAIAFTPDQDIYNEHCTGSALTSFFECVVSPGSTMSHETTFHADQSITFPGYGPELGGSWSQPTPETLHFEYTSYGVVAVTFDGWAVDAACWEGVVVSGAYTIPYSVCLD